MCKHVVAVNEAPSSTAHEVHAADDEEHSGDVDWADGDSVGDLGDDGGPDEGGCVDGIQDCQRAAAFEGRHEQDHHSDVAGHSSSELGVQQITCRRTRRRVCSGLVQELPNGPKKRGQEKQHDRYFWRFHISLVHFS